MIGCLEIRHYRPTPAQRTISCGAPHGISTTDLNVVDCPMCIRIAQRANQLAQECGCYRAHIHHAVAMVQIYLAEQADNAERARVHA